MAPQTRTVREALEGSNARLELLETDPTLSSAQQALVSELIQANTLALNALRADDTITPGQRVARAQQIEDKVIVNLVVQQAHEDIISIDAYYVALDLSGDAATAIREGVGTFISDISTS